MKTVSAHVADIVANSPFIEHALAEGILNLSAYARTIQPQLAKKLYKKVRLGSVIMALKRLGEELRQQEHARAKFYDIKDITLRSHLTEFNIVNSPQLVSLQRQLMKTLDEHHEAFLNISQGVRESSIVVDDMLKDAVRHCIPADDILLELTDLTSITIRLPKESIHTPGMYYSFLKALALKHINFIEIISVYCELTIILEEQYVEPAFHTIKKLGGAKGV